MICRLLIVVLVLCLTPVLVHAQWSNEPPGSTVLYDCALSGNFCNLSENVFNTFPFTNIASSGQISPTSALDIELCAGCSTGNGQWVNYYSPTLREFYFGTWWSTNSDFEGSANRSNKMFMFRNPAQDNSLIHWGGLPNGTRQVRWYFQTTYDECHVSGYVGGCWNGTPRDGTGYLQSNVSSACDIAAGSGWHKIELYLKVSTTTSSQNGIVKIWCDGTLASNYTNLNLIPLGMSEFHVNSGWDGSGPFACPGIRDCSKAWHHYIDHLRISACSGCAVPGGGGGDTTPPSRATGLTITQLN